MPSTLMTTCRSCGSWVRVCSIWVRSRSRSAAPAWRISSVTSTCATPPETVTASNESAVPGGIALITPGASHSTAPPNNPCSADVAELRWGYQRVSGTSASPSGERKYRAVWRYCAPKITSDISTPSSRSPIRHWSAASWTRWYSEVVVVPGRAAMYTPRASTEPATVAVTSTTPASRSSTTSGMVPE